MLMALPSSTCFFKLQQILSCAFDTQAVSVSEIAANLGDHQIPCKITLVECWDIKVKSIHRFRYFLEFDGGFNIIGQLRNTRNRFSHAINNASDGLNVGNEIFLLFRVLQVFLPAARLSHLPLRGYQ